MATHTYRVASPEGAAYSRAEEGDKVELDLNAETERAIVAAGWLEPVKEKGGK